LQFFDVVRESTIMVESLQPVRVDALKALRQNISPERVRDLASGSGAAAVAAIPTPEEVAEDVLNWLYKFSGLKGVIDDIKDSADDLEGALDALTSAIDWQGALQKGKGRPQ
jgi:hypothetical protein